MVLIVLMRLSEDVNGLDERLPPKRRKEMTGTLTENGNDLFEFFITILKSKAMLLKSEVSMKLEEYVCSTHKLVFLISYYSWMNSSKISGIKFSHFEKFSITQYQRVKVFLECQFPLIAL